MQKGVGEDQGHENLFSKTTWPPSYGTIYFVPAVKALVSQVNELGSVSRQVVNHWVSNFDVNGIK